MLLIAGLWSLLAILVPHVLLRLPSVLEESGWVIVAALVVIVPALLLALLFAASVFWGDFFGYVDAPLRFDRVRCKIYVWTPRAAGPLVLDWDTITPVAQSASAPPYQFNAFRSVLLVDQDAAGGVRFEGRLPRIAQIGAAVLDRGHTVAAYEFVRMFMEHGPQALPPVQEHLVWRPGVRSWFDIFGFLKGSIREWPKRSPQDRNIAWLALGIIAMTIAAPMFWPLQLSPRRRLAHDSCAALARRIRTDGERRGFLAPPAGSRSNDPPCSRTRPRWRCYGLRAPCALRVDRVEGRRLNGFRQRRRT